jgi:DNA-binding transcriptional LysR family regulator
MDDGGAVLDLNDFFYFVHVVDRGGFTTAGRTLRIPKSTLSHRIQQLETKLGVRLLNRTSRRFAITDAGGEFYRHAVAMLREAELAEAAIRRRLSEPTGTVRRTAAVATMQSAMRDIVADFLVRYPKVNVVAHATDHNVDIVGENYDIAITAHLFLCHAPWGASPPPQESIPGLTDLKPRRASPSVSTLACKFRPRSPANRRHRYAHADGNCQHFQT